AGFRTAHVPGLAPVGDADAHVVDTGAPGFAPDAYRVVVLYVAVRGVAAVAQLDFVATGKHPPVVASSAGGRRSQRYLGRQPIVAALPIEVPEVAVGAPRPSGRRVGIQGRLAPDGHLRRPQPRMRACAF